jgi:hypothetical protein
MPDSLIFSSIDPETNDVGVVINGVKWATRNLAAHGKFAEKPEDYGALFQWGRKGDGHEQRTSPNYPTNDLSDENGTVSGSENFDDHGQIINTHEAYGKFIKQSEQPFDWRIPQDDTLWNSGDENAPVKTINDPCPEGWRVPTRIELATLGGGEWINTPAEGRCFGSGTNIIFLPAAGSRYNNGAVGVGTDARYRSSTPSGIEVWYLFFTNESPANVYSNGIRRGSGQSVRCVAE